MEHKKTQKVHVSMAQNIHAMLVEMCKNKGLTRSAVLSIAVEKLYKEEAGR